MSLNRIRRIIKCKLPVAHHILHTYADFSVTIESAVETDDIRRVAFVKDHQFTDDLISYGWLNLQVD